MINKLIFVFFLFWSLLSSAQPGGGGGLEIRAIFDANLHKLSIRKDELSVRVFFLDDYVYGNIPTISHELDLKKSDTISLFPSGNLSLRYVGSTSLLNIRLCFFTKTDTSIVDFYNVLQSNPAGWHYIKDSIILKHGFTSYENSIYYKDSVIIRHNRYFKEQLLNPEKLPNTFYFKMGLDAEEKENYNDAVQYFTKALTAPSPYRSRSIDIQSITNFKIGEQHYSLKNYEKAEEYSMKAIKRNSSEDYYYRLAIQSLLKQGKIKETGNIYDLALKNLSHIQNASWIKWDWAMFNINVLHNYDSVIVKFEEYIRENKKFIFAPYNFDKAQSNNADEYFVLGLAKYNKSEDLASYPHFLYALENGPEAYNCKYQFSKFDTILKDQPNEAMPNLLYALAKYKEVINGAYNDSLLLQTYTNSYNYVLKAEQLGLTEHNTYYWKAFFLNSINKHDKALEQINIAISKNPNNANYYGLRAQIKQMLGSANWEQESNIDYKKSSQLNYSAKIKGLKIQAYNPTYFPKIMFRIRDYSLGQLYPSIPDTVYLLENSTKLTCKEIENIELYNKIILHSVATKTHHNSSKISKEYKKHLKRRKIVESFKIASIDLMNDTVNGLVFGFYQTLGCAENTKTILIKRGLEQMTLEIAGFLSGSPSDILLDSIPFQNEKLTIDFSKILNIKRNDNGSYQTIVKNHETNTYQIKPKLIRDFYKPPHDMQDFVSVNVFYNHWLSYLRKENYYKNDTTFYYYSDSLPNLFCKGVYKEFRHVSKRDKRHFTDPGFREHYRRVTKQIYRYGSWKYYDIDGDILLESHYKKMKLFAFKNNKTIPTGIWKYYEKGKLTMTEEYLPNKRFRITKY